MIKQRGKTFEPKKEVPSFELCKRLMELDFPQDTGGWYWVLMRPTSKKKDEFWVLDYRDGEYSLYNKKFTKEIIKAPTARELGEWLPVSIYKKEEMFLDIDRPDDTIWLVSYCLADRPACLITFEGETEADARAKMLIWLVENGYVSFDEGNEGDQIENGKVGGKQ